MTSFARRLIVPTLLLTLIGGCAAETPSVDVSACPPLIGYTKAQETQLADELDALPAGATITRRWIADYILTRDQLRACQPKRTGP